MTTKETPTAPTDPATPAAPAVPVWTCTFNDFPGAQTVSALTVGTKFVMQCHGDIPVQWEKAEPQISFKEEQEAYALTILKTEELNPQSVRFVVAGYKAGKHQPEFLRVLQGPNGFEVAKPQWEIKSVLKPNQKAEPVGPIGPFKLALPMWLWVGGALLLAFLLFAIVRRIRRAIQRQRMLAELKTHRTGLSPLNQFYRDARQLRRRLHAAQNEGELRQLTADLEREFRLYILRQFEIPSLEWSDSAIVKDLRRRYRPIWLRAGAPLKKSLRELVRLQNQTRVQSQDVEQLHRMALDTAERLERARAEVGQ